MHFPNQTMNIQKTKRKNLKTRLQQKLTFNYHPNFINTIQKVNKDTNKNSITGIVAHYCFH